MMGKVKRERVKLHNPAQRSKTDDAGSMQSQPVSGFSGLQAAPGFSRLDIDIAALSRELSDNDPETRSAITSKSLKGLNLKKKDKQKLRHELWLKKVDVIKMAKKEESDKKKRKQTAITGDLKPLEDALPTLDLLMKTSAPSKPEPQDKTKTLPYTGLKKESIRKKEMLADINLFSQVIKHPAFKANPIATITEHLTNRQKLEDSLDNE